MVVQEIAHKHRRSRIKRRNVVEDRLMGKHEATILGRSKPQFDRQQVELLSLVGRLWELLACLGPISSLIGWVQAQQWRYFAGTGRSKTPDDIVPSEHGVLHVQTGELLTVFYLYLYHTIEAELRKPPWLPVVLYL